MKKKRNKKTRRIIYKYTCRGCGKRRLSFDFERAKAEICKVCEPQKADINQGALFDEPHEHQA